MVKINDTSITVTEGDYGYSIPVLLTGENFKPDDDYFFIVKNTLGEILNQKYTDLKSNEEGKLIIDIEINKEMSEKLKKGDYIWGIVQVRDESILRDTLVYSNSFNVEGW